MNAHDISPLSDSILYVLSLLREGERPIDRYIDYFGEGGTSAPTRRLKGRR
jgi:hypothetical protein